MSNVILGLFIGGVVSLVAIFLFRGVYGLYPKKKDVKG